MTIETSLVIDTTGGEQIVRRPRRTDTIGAILRDAFGGVRPLPGDIARLIAALERCRITRR
jgi:hypothetical protein